MTDTISIVDALRCSTGKYKDRLSCNDCPYMAYVGDYVTCDCDTMALDAANRIVVLEQKVREANNKVLQLKLDRGIYGND